MYSGESELEMLAAQVARGDPQAAVQLRQQLEDEMVRIVRRTLQTGAAITSLARGILAEARRLAPDYGDQPAERQELLIDRIARRLCTSVLDRLRTGPPRERLARETVRN